jgi:hypothetical protein
MSHTQTNVHAHLSARLCCHTGNLPLELVKGGRSRTLPDSPPWPPHDPRAADVSPLAGKNAGAGLGELVGGRALRAPPWPMSSSPVVGHVTLALIA